MDLKDATLLLAAESAAHPALASAARPAAAAGPSTDGPGVAGLVSRIMSKTPTTLCGRIRTTSSPGTPLRWPNSLARSGPMYLAAIAVAVRTSSAGSSDSSATPCTWMNA